MQDAIRTSGFCCTTNPVSTSPTAHPRHGGARTLAPSGARGDPARRFIPLAEETGFIIPLGDWVLREACRRAIAWQRSRSSSQPLTLRVNVSARQLAQDSLCETVAAIIQETGIVAANLCLEVTESVLIEDPESSIRTLTQLKKLGVKIAIDDFGTGYSSLEYLPGCPSTASRSTARSCAACLRATEDMAIVGAVIELGHALKLSVTAEGVETADQLDHLQTAGCDTAQGFLFYRPEPPDVVEQLLADTHAAAAAERAEAESSPAGISGGAGPIDGIDRASPASVSRAPRRLMPPPGAPGSRRRLARSSLVAGIKAMTHTWLNSA